MHVARLQATTVGRRRILQSDRPDRSEPHGEIHGQPVLQDIAFMGVRNLIRDAQFQIGPGLVLDAEGARHDVVARDSRRAQIEQFQSSDGDGKLVGRGQIVIPVGFSKELQV